MIVAGDILWGGVLPALVAAALMLGVWTLGHNTGLAWLAGLTLGVLAGLAGLDAQTLGLAAAVGKMVRPHEARDWLPAALLSAAAIEALSYWPRWPTTLGWILRLAWCSFFPWRALAGSVYLPETAPAANFDTGAWTITEACFWLGGSSALLAICWWLLRRMPAGSLPRLRSTLTSLVALGAAATVAFSGSLTTGQLLGVLAAALVGCGMVAAVLRLERGPEAAAGPLVATYGGVLVIAAFLLSPELSRFATLMLLAALIAAVGWIDPPHWLSGRGLAAVRIAVCLAALAAAIIPAARDFAHAQAESASNPYFQLQP